MNNLIINKGELDEQIVLFDQYFPNCLREKVRPLTDLLQELSKALDESPSVTLCTPVLNGHVVDIKYVEILCVIQGTTLEELKKKNNRPEFVWKRFQIFSLLSMNLPPKQIGKFFDRERLTVVHGLKQHKKYNSAKFGVPKYKEDYTKLLNITRKNVEH